MLLALPEVVKHLQGGEGCRAKGWAQREGGQFEHGHLGAVSGGVGGGVLWELHV